MRRIGNKVMLAVLVLMAVSCKKNAIGGDSTIEGVTVHHSKVIANASVFIKYDAEEFPGSDTTKYDSKVRADKDGNFSFKVYKGKYYIFAFGYDYAIAAPYHVVGGVPVKIRDKEKVTITMPLTEGD